MKKQTIVDIISLLLIILFVYAASSKLIDYQKFQVQLGQSPLLTEYASVVAWAIPVFEVIISSFLAINTLRIVGLFASFTLMTIFTAYIIVITQFAEYVPCSCGGVLQKLGWTEHLIFNICFVILIIAAVFLENDIVKGKKKEIKTVNTQDIKEALIIPKI